MQLQLFVDSFHLLVDFIFFLYALLFTHFYFASYFGRKYFNFNRYFRFVTYKNQFGKRSLRASLHRTQYFNEFLPLDEKKPVEVAFFYALDFGNFSATIIFLWVKDSCVLSHWRRKRGWQNIKFNVCAVSNHFYDHNALWWLSCNEQQPSYEMTFPDIVAACFQIFCPVNKTWNPRREKKHK